MLVQLEQIDGRIITVNTDDVVAIEPFNKGYKIRFKDKSETITGELKENEIQKLTKP